MLTACASCDDPAPQPSHRTAAVTAGGDAAATHVAAADRVTIGSEPDIALASGEIVVRGGWGQGLGEFGRRGEAGRPGPMSLTVGSDRSVYVLDQVNRRVQHFDAAGRLRDAFAVPSETTEDIALIGRRLWALVLEPTAPARYALARLSGSDRRPQRFSLPPSLELVTGMFVRGTAEEPEIWLEERHDTQRLVLTGDHAVAADAPPVRRLGRPIRGTLRGERISARLRGDHEATVFVVRRGDGVRPLVHVRTRLPLIGLHALDTAPDGAVYLGLLVGRESGPPDYGIERARRLVLIWRGAERKSLVVELADPMATEAFRTTAVGQDGALYQLHTTEKELTVRRWDLPGGTGARGQSSPAAGGAS